ncbi:MAG: hypothetical protein CMG67_00695 [Candidatus Marinimicrobia bacterium]|nr:hypothetical protein [Candidatus Neomarinimicrobiota bacterium]|tara:strand:- start:443 stop:3160 length:2718 start_codon:yes stop_codon:yes gene_type:complete
MKKFLRIIIFLNLSFVLFFPLESDEITENTSVIKKVKELGKFAEPRNYPTGMRNFFLTGCNGFVCTADNLTKDMIALFNRKGAYLEKYPGTQLYAMAMFEVFYQKKLKDNEDKINEFIEISEGKKKNGKNIESLIRLNEARKKMRSSLGMDLQISTEKAMENYWTLGDFLNQGEIKKNKIDKEIKKRKKIIEEYRSIVSRLKISILKEKEKKFYDKLIDKKLNLKLNLKKDKYTKFNNDILKLRKKINNLPEGKKVLAKNFDKAMEEINGLTDIVVKNIQNEALRDKGLNLLQNKLANVENKLSKEYSNDLSKVDINKISKNAPTVMQEVTQNIKSKKESDTNTLIADMSEFNKQGFNIFKLNRNLKQMGFKTIKFETISKFLNNNETINETSNKSSKLILNRIDFITKSMSKLGYKNSEINKEIEIIKSTGINSELAQNILTARQMIISGASDKEIQDEINSWSSINVSNLQNDAYLTALNARSKGILAKNIKNKIQTINAVETYRQVDKLLDQVEEQVDKSSLPTLALSDNDEQNALVFAQVGGSGYTNNFFSDGSKDVFYDKFLSNQKNKQVEIFQKKFTTADIYREINTPLTIVSLIVSPSPLHVIKLAKIAKEKADKKKARILAAASFGTGEDELGAGDYVDPRIFERTVKVLNAIQIKDIESKNLAKKLNYSIKLISLEATTDEITDQSDEADIPKDICVAEDCYVPGPTLPERPLPINPIMPIDVFIKKAERVKKVELIKNFQTMIQDKNISNLEISNRTLSNTKVMNMQLYFEELGIADAADKVSKAYAEVGLSKDGMPSIDAIMDSSFNITAHLDAMDAAAYEADLQADITSASQAAADIQDAINAAGNQISEDLAQANAEAQQAVHDAQKALDESRKDPNRDRSGESCASDINAC